MDPAGEYAGSARSAVEVVELLVGDAGEAGDGVGFGGEEEDEWGLGEGLGESAGLEWRSGRVRWHSGERPSAVVRRHQQSLPEGMLGLRGR
jgi:hypothetical protein